MNKNNRFAIQPIVLGGLLCMPWSANLLAANSPLNDVMKAQESQTTKAIDTSSQKWANWILSQVQALPSLKASHMGTLVANEERSAMQQPLYNPELNLSYTEKDEEEYGVGVSQTIDWYNKGSARSSLGQVNYELADLDRQLDTESKLAEALYAYIDYATEKQLLVVAKQQEQLLEQLSADLKVREELGDVGNLDAELAYLSFSQNLQQISLREIRFRKALAGLEETLDTQKVPFRPKSSVWKNDLQKLDLTPYLKQVINQGLKTQKVQKQLEQSQALSKIAKLERKSNPNLGFGLGRDGSENTVSLEFSIPLNVRNNFSAEYRAALKKVSQSELEMLEEKRVLEKQIRLSFDNYQELSKRVLKWENITTKRVKGSKKILSKLWQSGDMTTSDYLFSLQQRTDSLIATIELNTEMQKAWIDWLVLTSQVESWLKHL